VLAAYCLHAVCGVVVVIGSFLLMNYLFIEPRFTFVVGDFRAWVALLGFLIVSLTISSLLKRLRAETEKTLSANNRILFSRDLVEEITSTNDIEEMLHATCRILHEGLQTSVGIAQMQTDGSYVITHGRVPLKTNADALLWAAQTGKAIGPHTGNWQSYAAWIIPFDNLPGQHPVLIIDGADTSSTGQETLSDLRMHADHIHAVYQRLLHSEQAHKAELMAQEESIQNALLASISHDMRTPLTSIIGAATTLREQGSNLPPSHYAEMLDMVISEAGHLSASTENILCMVQLESSQNRVLTMDWQSPEELVGIVLARYQKRQLNTAIKPGIHSNALIRANAMLVTQALANLIDNALATHRGEEPIMVEVHEVQGTVMITVADRGEGFPQGFTSEKVGKFRRLTKTGKGFGLGLAIVQSIMQKHHGQLHISTREGGGSKVSLHFSHHPAPKDTAE
jgi:two-component system sensor histidine kinase KdpD